MTDAATADEAVAAKADQNGEREQTCFVVIGFGEKTDYATGRVLNLDKTYEQLIKPAFDNVGIRCFRAIDVNVTGSIDMLMYHWIYHADYVVADLSTMNANVFYELGVRHAQKPNTTLIMAEKGLFSKLPFDLSHTIIYGYEHMGDQIDPDEAEQFVATLTAQLEKLLAEPPKFDSPVYTYLRGMQAPLWEDPEERIARLEKQLDEKLAAGNDAEEVGADASLAALIKTAEKAKKAGQWGTAKALFRTAIDNSREAAAGDEGPPDIDECEPEPAVDVFLWQRLALCTYKEGESFDEEGAIAALKEADRILACKCENAISTDPETLGLSGAVHKRLYERTGKRQHFEKSVAFYERGFYIKQDYYNGVNAAYMYTTEAARLAEAGDRYNAIVNYGHGNMIRRRVAEICEGLRADPQAFAKRGDKEWVTQTLWEAYIGMGETEKAEELQAEMERASAEAKQTLEEQKEKLAAAMMIFADLIASLEDTPSEPTEVEAVGTAGALPVVAHEAARVVRSASGDAFSVDLGALRDKPVKSVEVKVEFAE